MDDAQPTQPAKPPKAVAVAVALGVFFHVFMPASSASKLGLDGMDMLVSAIVAAIVLFGVYRMRRWAVVTYALLAIATILVGTATRGVTWRGLLMALVLRTAVAGPSLYYWKRLS